MEPYRAYVEPRVAEVCTMMRMLPFLLALLFLPEIAEGQSADIPNDSESLPIVRATEVEVGLGSKLLQVASIAFNPTQRNTHWPHFAYPLDAVFASRTCDSFSEALMNGKVAFVRPENSDVGSKRTFLGVQIPDASHIRDLCASPDYSETLQNLLTIESNSSVQNWYLLSERPLRHIESSFRTRMVPLGVDVDNGN